MLHYHHCVVVFLQQDVRAGLYKCTGERQYDVEAAQNGMLFKGFGTWPKSSKNGGMYEM